MIFLEQTNLSNLTMTKEIEALKAILKKYDDAILALRNALEIVPGLNLAEKVLELAEKAKETNLSPKL